MYLQIENSFLRIVNFILNGVTSECNKLIPYLSTINITLSIKKNFTL